MMFDEDQTRKGAGESPSDAKPRKDERRSRALALRRLAPVVPGWALAQRRVLSVATTR